MPYFFSTIVATQDFSYKILKLCPTFKFYFNHWLYHTTMDRFKENKNEKGSSTNTV